jgi:hypothetical protein
VLEEYERTVEDIPSNEVCVCVCCAVVVVVLMCVCVRAWQACSEFTRVRVMVDCTALFPSLPRPVFGGYIVCVCVCVCMCGKLVCIKCACLFTGVDPHTSHAYIAFSLLA